MSTLSRKIQSIEESQTLRLAEKARRLKATGLDIISLTAGEPDFPTPRHVKEAAIKAIEQNFTRYTANEGMPDLLNAIVRKFSEENNLHYEPAQILVSTGAKQCIFNVLQALCNKGDEVVILSPYWVSYPEMVKLVDAVPVIVKTSMEKGYHPDIRSLRRAIHSKTKAVILNSPGNPSGAVFSRSELEDIAAIVRETGVYVISDEIYEKVTYDGHRHFSIGSMHGVCDRVITVNGVSKAYSMTGWRIGYMGGPHAVMQAAAKVQSQVTSNANSIAQKATIAALTGSSRDIDTMVEEFSQRRTFAIEALKRIRGVEVTSPEGAFYILFNIGSFLGRTARRETVRTSDAMASYLLDHHHVGLIPGAAFGADTCLRLSYACSLTELEKGIGRVKNGLEELQ